MNEAISQKLTTAVSLNRQSLEQIGASRAKLDLNSAQEALSATNAHMNEIPVVIEHGSFNDIAGALESQNLADVSAAIEGPLEIPLEASANLAFDSEPMSHLIGENLTSIDFGSGSSLMSEAATSSNSLLFELLLDPIICVEFLAIGLVMFYLSKLLQNGTQAARIR